MKTARQSGSGVNHEIIGIIALALLGFLTFDSQLSTAQAQNTAFTYQGMLTDAGQSASGPHDFRFRLFDVAVDGVPVGSQLCVDNVPVSGGTFTTTIDFGPQFATTAGRFLEIEVRRDTGLGCGNASGFVVLSPRQRITAAPFATHANTSSRAATAYSLSTPAGSVSNAVFVDNGGRVGIGLPAPGHRLDVSAGFLGDGIGLRGTAPNDPAYHLYDGAASRGALGLALQNGSWSASAAPGDIVLRSGTAGKLLFQNGALAAALALTGNNVGIGTVTPAAKLHVSNGDLLSGAPGEEWIFHTRSSFGGDFLHITDQDAGRPQFQRGLTLDENGNLGMRNANSTVFATGGEENLRIVRGTIFASGAIVTGAGFTVSRTGDALYSITFTRPFSGDPTVTASLTPTWDERFIEVVSVSVTRVQIRTFEWIPSLPEDRQNEIPENFHFIAVGPR